ncbi:MAG: DUF2383 domain-containing protein [Silvanigrellales bacterium]|nr:DUF2383 domain-containing protein [Silvanigrellales bacterium]
MFKRIVTTPAWAIHPNESYRPVVPDPFLQGMGLPPEASYDPYLQSETFFADSESEAGIKWLNRLVRGEISAIETYEIVLKDSDLKNDEVRVLLAHNVREHREARTALEKLVLKWRGKPEITSGAWGAFTETLTASANAMSTSWALGALMKGEEHGREEYLSMLEDMNSDSELANLCREMLRAQERHTRRLSHAKRSLEVTKNTLQ